MQPFNNPMLSGSGGFAPVTEKELAPSTGFTPITENDLLPPDKISFDSARKDPRLLNAVRDFAKWRSNEDLKTDEEAFNWFVENRREVDMNSASAIRQAVNASQAANSVTDQRQLDNIRTMMDYWDRLPGVFEKGGQGVRGVLDNVGEALQDPANLIGFGAGALAAKAGVKLGLGVAGRAVASGVAGAAVDAGTAATSNYAVQSAEVDTKRRDQIDTGEVATAAAIGGASSILLTGASTYFGEKLATTLASREAPRPSDVGVNARNDPAEAALRDLAASTFNQNEANLAQNLKPFRILEVDTGRELAAYATIGEVKKAMSTLPPAQQNSVMVSEGGTIRWTDNKAFDNFLRNTLGLSTTKLEMAVNDKAALRDFAKFTEKYGDAAIRKRSGLSELNVYEGALSSENAPVVAEMATTAEGHLAAQMRYDMTKGFSYINGSESLYTILRDVGDAHGTGAVKDLEEWILLKRSLAIYKSGRLGKDGKPLDVLGPNWNPQLASQRLATIERDFPDVLQYGDRLKQYNINFLSLMQDFGMLDAATASRYLRENEYYLPFDRMAKEMGFEEVLANGINGSTLRKNLQGVKGSETSLMNGFEAYKNSVDAAIQAGVQNANMRRLVSEVNSLPPDMRKLIMSTDTNNNPLKGENPVQGKTGESITVYENGKAVSYRIHDPLLALSAARFKNAAMLDTFDKSTLPGRLGSLIQGYTQLLTYTITRFPDFVFGNTMILDPLTQFFLSDKFSLKGLPYLNSFVEGMPKIVRDRKLYLEAVANAGLQGGATAQHKANMFRNALEKRGIKTDNILGLTAEQDASVRAKLGTSIVNRVSKVMNAIDSGVDLIESGPRMQEYTSRLAEFGGNAAKAGAVATLNNINFRQRSAYQGMNMATSLLPFMRAIINANYRMGRVLTFRDKGDAVRNMKIASLYTLPGIAYVMATLDDPRYQDLTPDQRATNFYFFNDDGPTITYRKEETAAFFLNTIEYTLNEIRTKQPEDFQALKDLVFDVGGFTLNRFAGNFGDAEGSQAILQFTPVGLRQAIEVAANTKFSGPIVPTHLENPANPSEEYIPGRTSKTFQALGKEWGLSPMKMEHAFRSFIGPLASAALDFERYMDPNAGPRMNWYDAPVVRRFVQDPNEPRRITDSSQRFYDIKEQAKNQVTAVEGAVKNLRPDAAKEYFDTVIATDPQKKAFFDSYPGLETTALELARLRREMRSVEEISDYPGGPEGKQREVNRLQGQINAVMRDAVKNFYLYRNQVNDQTDAALAQGARR